MIKKIVGEKFDKFEEFCRKDGEKLQEARLIPVLKPGDEGALTSVFLSALRLVKDFRKDFLSEIGMHSGKIHVYREITFPKQPEQVKGTRIDGMIIIVRGNTISDAAFLEMKKKGNNLNKDDNKKQVESYIEIAKQFGVEHFITISNECVLHSSQSPLEKIKKCKKVDLRHFSWTDILTTASLVLFKVNQKVKIDNPDQIEILKEVVSYWEDDRSGVCRFTYMGDDWEKIGQFATKEQSLPPEAFENAIRNWHQEEKNMALELSRKIGVSVKNKNGNSKNSFERLVEATIKEFKKSKKLKSKLFVKGTASDIDVVADMKGKKLEMSASFDVQIKDRKKETSKIKWIRDEVEKCIKCDEIKKDINIRINNKSELYPLLKFDKSIKIKDKKISRFEIVYIRELGKIINEPRKFVGEIEDMLFRFYDDMISNFKLYKSKVKRNRTASDSNQSSEETV